MSRKDPQLARPDADRLAKGFPVRALARTATFHRSVRVGNGPWRFSSSKEGRFDLSAPEGTCYLAADIETAIWERLGVELASVGVAPYPLVADMEVFTLVLPHSVTVANAGHKDAKNFGCIREVSTTSNYDLTQQWAQALHALPSDGVSYASRFTSAASANALALFGMAGEAKWPVQATVSGETAMRMAGMSTMIGRRTTPRAAAYRKHSARPPV